jgi:polyisoprenyl-phosphate glycosyltransferase
VLRREPLLREVARCLPCCSEEGHVIAEMERICAAMDASGYSCEVLAIDDAATDQTLDRLYEAAPRFPTLQVMHFHRNGGPSVVRRIARAGARPDRRLD